MKFTKYLPIMLFAAATLFVSSCSKSEDKTAGQASGQTNQTAPTKVYQLASCNTPTGSKVATDFSWNDNGKEIKFSEFTKGKFVLLNFWGTWCPPCRRELPDIVSISSEMANKNLVVIGAALERTSDPNEARQTVANFWQNNQLNYPVVIASAGLAEAYGGISAVPTTFFITNKGEIFNFVEGAMSKEAFLDQINKMMKN